MSESRWHPADDQPAARARLFCFPSAGAGASTFSSWRGAMPGTSVLPIQLPGREARIAEPLPETLSGLVDALATAVAELDDLPFGLLGHSFGGVLAYEIARLLAADSRPPLCLFISALAPSGNKAAQLAALPDPTLCDFLRVLGGTEDAVFDYAGLRALTLKIVRADFRLAAQWTGPRGALALDAHLLAGRDDPLVRPDAVAEWRGSFNPPPVLLEYDGGHFFFIENRDAVVGDVRSAVEQALTRTALHT
jgi:surfactin synthase thioesterase subunit